MKEKILLIDSDQNNVRYVKLLLASNGYTVLCASTFRQAYSLVNSHCPDLIISETTLSDESGQNFLLTVREWSTVPILFLSADNEEKVKVELLEGGADDYIVKPFGAAELVARVRVAMRHAKQSGENEILGQDEKLTIGDLCIDYAKYRVYLQKNDADLTPGEFRLLALLGRYPDRVLTYNFIIRELYGPYRKVDNQILRVNVTHIRRKIEKDPANPVYLITEKGIGYRLSTDGV